MMQITEKQARSRCEVGKMENMTVRFFVYGLIDDEIDLIEVTESDFLDTQGGIEYERNTVFQNGINQICLTKRNR